jgi:hypothetical protein
MIDDVGAKAEFGTGFVAGTRREEATDGGGRTAPLPGRGGTVSPPTEGGLSRGGLDDRLGFGGGGIIDLGGGGIAVALLEISGGVTDGVLVCLVVVLVTSRIPSDTSSTASSRSRDGEVFSDVSDSITWPFVVCVSVSITAFVLRLEGRL